MRITVSILAILFGLLHIAAAIAQFKSKDPVARGSAVLMICGGVTVAGAAIFVLTGGVVTCLELAVGLLGICFAAYLNGRRSGDFHLSHHIVRGAAAALLVAGFLIWQPPRL